MKKTNFITSLNSDKKDIFKEKRTINMTSGSLGSASSPPQGAGLSSSLEQVADVPQTSPQEEAREKLDSLKENTIEENLFLFLQDLIEFSSPLTNIRVSTETNKFALENNRALVGQISARLKEIEVEKLKTLIGSLEPKRDMDKLSPIEQQDLKRVFSEIIAVSALNELKRKFNLLNPEQQQRVNVYNLNINKRGDLEVNFPEVQEAMQEQQEETDEEDEELTEEDRIERLKTHWGGFLDKLLRTLGIIDESNEAESYKKVVNGRNLFATIVLGVLGQDAITGGTWRKTLRGMTPAMRGRAEKIADSVRGVVEKGASKIGLDISSNIYIERTSDFIDLLGVELKDNRELRRGITLATNIELGTGNLPNYLEIKAGEGGEIIVPEEKSIELTDGVILRPGKHTLPSNEILTV